MTDPGILVGWTVVGLLCGGVFGVPLTYFGVRRCLAERSVSGRVERVDATVTASTVESHASRESRHHLYRPVVNFRYEYGGRTYESDLFAYERTEGYGSSRSSAYGKIADYPEGETVTAHVDPQRPGRAFLERDGAGGTALAVLFVVFGLALTVGGLSTGLLFGLVMG